MERVVPKGSAWALCNMPCRMGSGPSTKLTCVLWFNQSKMNRAQLKASLRYSLHKPCVLGRPVVLSLM
jgi:hypothetical protein